MHPHPIGSIVFGYVDWDKRWNNNKRYKVDILIDYLSYVGNINILKGEVHFELQLHYK